MNTTEGFFRVDTHRITFDPVASRCTGACEGEACNCTHPRHLEPAEACTDLGSDGPISTATRRFWQGYVLLLVVIAGMSAAAWAGWLP